MMSAIPSHAIWERESNKTKISALLKLNWSPTESLVKEMAKEVFKGEVFGSDQDYGEEIGELMVWHNSRDWDLSYLTEDDKLKAKSLTSMTITTRLRYYKETSDLLPLHLMDYAPHMCGLIKPMVVKIPVVSIQHFLEVDVAYSFNSIRKAQHPETNGIISYFYDLLFLQQKIAISLYEFIRLTAYAEEKKKEALLINAEVNAIMQADLVISYLKASVEKTVVLIGLIHSITNLDSKKTHKAKIEALIKELPKKVTDQFYWNFIHEFIKSENLEQLNNYRTGLMHKKGISDLQPHNYVGQTAGELPLKKVFQFIHEQHSKNTAIILGALAILTDDLVTRDFPTEIPPDLMKLLKQFEQDGSTPQ
jgi:hypothetical protein